MTEKHLVFLGDSLTEWFDWQRRFPEHRVLNLGISGETAEELLDRRDLIRASVENPDFVFLMTGINNVLSERYAVTEPVREIVRNLTTWYKSGCIVVQSLLPVDMPWISNETIRDINRNLAVIAREWRSEYLDIYGLFVDTEGQPRKGLLLDDGVHVSERGYEVWAGEVERFLKSAR